MPSQVATIAEAVKAALNAAPDGTFSQAFEARRLYVPEDGLEALAELTVTVVPKANDRTPQTRAAVLKEIQVDVGVRKRLAQGTDPAAEDANAEIDALMLVVEEVAGHLDHLDVPAANARWVATTNDPVYDMERLRGGEFASLVTLSFKAV